MKKQIIDLLKELVENKRNLLEKSQKDSQDEANAHKGAMQSRYDTFKEEAQYLAAAYGEQLTNLSQDAALLRSLEKEKMDNNMFSIITVYSNDKKTKMLMSPVLGGEKVVYNGETLQVITPNSPMGAKLINAEEGDEFQVNGRDVEVVQVKKPKTELSANDIAKIKGNGQER